MTADLLTPHPTGEQRAIARPQLSFEEALEALDLRQQDFVRHYVREPVGARAAHEAGYAKSSAYNHASYLLSMPAVQLAISIGRLECAAAMRLDVLEWIRELCIIAYCDPSELRCDADGEAIRVPGKEHWWRAVKRKKITTKRSRDGSVSVEVNLEMHSKLDALRMLGQYAGWLTGDLPETVAPVMPVIKGVEPRDVLGE